MVQHFKEKHVEILLRAHWEKIVDFKENQINKYELKIDDQVFQDDRLQAFENLNESEVDVEEHIYQAESEAYDENKIGYQGELENMYDRAIEIKEHIFQDVQPNLHAYDEMKFVLQENKEPESINV